MKRRKTMRRNQRRKHSAFGMFLLFCLAVGSGYLGVRCIVEPWMDQHTATVASGDGIEEAADPPQTQENGMSGEESMENIIVEDKVDTVATTAYAVQLGSFSTEDAAKQRIRELNEQGITANIQLRDNAWKVVSEGFSTKEEAQAAAMQWRQVIGDAFVVAI